MYAALYASSTSFSATSFALLKESLIWFPAAAGSIFPEDILLSNRSDSSSKSVNAFSAPTISGDSSSACLAMSLTSSPTSARALVPVTSPTSSNLTPASSNTPPTDS